MRNLPSLLLLLIPLLASGQNRSEWGAFTFKMDAEPFEGKRFRLEAAVKVHCIDPDAQAHLWVRVDKARNKMGFFYNMADKPIKAEKWKVVTISGVIDKKAKYLLFGGIYARKGIFYFDDFKLFVEDDDGGAFKKVDIPNGGFEEDTLTHWHYLKKKNGFTVSLTSETAFEGKQSCVVDGSAFRKQYRYGDNDSTGRFAMVNGVKIWYEEYGSGPPLLLLHGNSESIYSFKAQIPEFAKHYRVIAVDTRGHGKSGDDGKDYSYDLFADDMNALLEHLQIESVYVVGWSDGGNTGLIMAMKYPDKVKKLVTMGANVFIDNTVVDKWVIRVLKKQQKELQSDTSEWARNRIRRIHLLLTQPQHSFSDLEKITCPVLVVAGEKDIIREEHTRAIATHIPNGTALIAPKETHEYPRENAPAFNQVVLDFLNE